MKFTPSPSTRLPLGRLIARRVLGAADLVTVNDPDMGRRVIDLGLPEQRCALVRLGIDPEFLEAPLSSVKLAPVGHPPAILSDRALERLYNIDLIIRAFA